MPNLDREGEIALFCERFEPGPQGPGGFEVEVREDQAPLLCLNERDVNVVHFLFFQLGLEQYSAARWRGDSLLVMCSCDIKLTQI